MMRLDNLDFIKLLPRFMREDKAVQGLAAAMNDIIHDLAASVSKLSTWDCIDELNEAALDELAWELNIEWYDKNAAITVKREIVKDSDIVHQFLGTKWAVERVINTYFGDGEIEEWFEYGGEPGHFRVLSSNPSINNTRLDEFLSLLQRVKRASAKLDAVVISNSGNAVLSAGVGFHDTGIDRWRIDLV